MHLLIVRSITREVLAGQENESREARDSWLPCPLPWRASYEFFGM